MDYTVHDDGGQVIIEGIPGQSMLERVEDVNRILEACWENGARSVLLYPENLTPQFFDLSSREAGEILQKLRQYEMRIAIVRTPELHLSTLFGELIRDENRGPYFRLLDDRDTALTWLRSEG